MKRKTLLLAVMIAVLGCLFAVSISATQWFGEVEIIDNDNDGNSDIVVTDRVPNVVTEGDVKTEDALVKLSCDCASGSHTFPAYYVTTINSNARTTLYGFSYAALNELKADYCGGTADYSLANIIALEIPAGYQSVYSGIVKNASGIKYLSFAKLSTATTVNDANSGYNWLEGTGVEEINLGSYLTKVPSFLCNNCDSLTSVVIPDQIKEIGAYAFTSCNNLKDVYISENSQLTTFGARCFRDCASLEAMYIPKGVTAFGVSGSEQSPFQGCTNMYFISDPDVRTKSSVYYFPSTVTEIVGETFKKCTNLNDVLVFHSGITSVSDGWAFNGSNAVTVVFLGDMEKVSTTGNAWNSNITIYFCNEKDLSSADVTVGNAPKKVYCHAETNETHLKELTKTTEANCEYPKMTADYCFCGEIIGTPLTSGEALGHLFNAEAVYEFTSLLVGGKKHVGCARENCEETETTELKAIIINLGYSMNEEGEKKSFINGYRIDNDLLVEYEKQKNVTVTLGYVFTSAHDFTKDEVTLDSFKINAPISRTESGIGFDAFIYKVAYGDDEHLDDDIIISAYIVEGETLTFVDRNQDTTQGTNGFNAQSYNDIAEICGLLK